MPCSSSGCPRAEAPTRANLWALRLRGRAGVSEIRDTKTASGPAGNPDDQAFGIADQVVGWRPVVKVCVLVAAIVACLVAVRMTDLGKYLDDPDWRRDLRAHMGPWLALLYVGGGSLLIAASFPRVWYSALGGALFGAVWGTIWGHLATMAGSALCFWFCRSLGREWIEAKYGRRFEGIERRLREEGFPIMLLVRLCPVGNNFLTNCLAGVSAIRFRPFLAASFIGHLPLTVLFGLMGAGVAKGEDWKTTVGLAGLVAFVATFVVYFRTSSAARDVARSLRGGTSGASAPKEKADGSHEGES